MIADASPVELVSHAFMIRETFLEPVHTHSRWTLFAVEKGRFSYEIEGNSSEGTKGDLVLFRPHRRVDRRVVHEPLHFHFISFNWCHPEAMEDHPLTRNVSFVRFTPSDQERLFSTFQYIHLLGSQSYLHSLKAIEHYTNDLFMMIQLEQGLSHTTVHDSLMEKVKDVLSKTAFQGIALKQVARSFNLSAVQLTRRFRAAFRVSPFEYWNHLRLEKVKTLLEETEYTLEHIAQASGFSNGYYLSRVFTRKMKLTPSQYRKIHRI